MPVPRHVLTHELESSSLVSVQESKSFLELVPDDVLIGVARTLDSLPADGQVQLGRDFSTALARIGC